MPRRRSTDLEARERIRAWLKAYMDARGWSMQRVAEELGVHQPTIPRFMSGERGAGLDLLLAIHRKLRVSTDDVLAGRLETATASGASAPLAECSEQQVGEPEGAEEAEVERRRLGQLDPTIGARIDALRAERGMPAKALYLEMGLDKGQYSRKVRGLTSVFASEAADAARVLRAPPGWPYVTVEQGLLIAALGTRVTDVLQALPEILELLARRRQRRSEVR